MEGSNMTVSEIQELLWKLYNNHDYHLYNSYLYNWECDYYSRSKSGYDYEVEIKLSRSDFFADFKKYKHRIFSAHQDKTKFIVQNHGVLHGKVIAHYEIARLANIKRRMYPSSYSQLDISNSATHEDYLNGYKNFQLQKQLIPIYAKYSSINIVPIEKMKLPHRFFYACPDGLLKPEEIPSYAGLIYCYGSYAKEVKKAPFLHKRDVDLTSVLLKKFYWETVEHRRNLRLEKFKK